MHIPVYFEDRVVKVTNALEKTMKDGFDAIHEFSSYSDLKLFLDKFETNYNLKVGILYGSGSVEALLEHLKNCYRYIEAAGGVVGKQDDTFLFIYRRGKWDLPKGKKEKKEVIEETAVREVREECGLTDCSISDYLTATYHTYRLKGKACLKKTSWYRMETKEDRVKPQIEEDIVKVEWVSRADFGKIKSNTYRSVFDVIEEI